MKPTCTRTYTKRIVSTTPHLRSGMFLGTWRSTSLKAWKESHSLMWPEMQAPELLVPLASRLGGANEVRHFQEATLPTSILWACLVSQSSSPKRTIHQRLLAATAFYEIIMAVFRAGDMELQVQWGNTSHRVPVASSGVVASNMVFGSLSPNQLATIKNEWAGDCQERGFVHVYTCFEIVGCASCAFNSWVGRKQNLDDCLGTSP